MYLMFKFKYILCCVADRLDETKEMPAFWKLQEAIDVASKCKEKCHIFSFQVSRSGGRKFQVNENLDDFWKMYEKTEPKYFYEVLRVGMPCRLYYDLEFFADQNPVKSGHEMVEKLIQLNKMKLEELGHPTTDSSIMVLEAFYKQKFSCHLVFHDTYFADNQAIGAFVDGIIQSLSPADKNLFTVYQQGGEQLFVDLSVYKQNQQMRCLMSRKLGRMNPLIISSISRSKYKEFSKESFFASLLTHGDSSDDKLVKIETSATTREIINREISSSKESPWIEIDKVITNLIKPSGRISGWTHRTKTNTYCYSIVGNAFCRNVNREHSHSKVYYMYCFSNHTLWQQCFSSHCEGFKSEPIEIPDFSWLSDNDSWSD